MRAFVEMRRYISSNLIEQKYINELIIKHEDRINVIEEVFSQFKEANNKKLIKTLLLLISFFNII